MARRKRKFEERYRDALKLAVRGKRGKIDIDSLPKVFHKRYLKDSEKWRQRNLRSKPKNLDSKIYLHKYYPWSYREFVPTLYLQGYYNESFARKRFLDSYGPNALKYVNFVKGKDALEREFAIGNSLYINNRWVKPKSKLSIPKDVNHRKARKSYGEQILRTIPNGNSDYQERVLIKNLEGLEYGTKKHIRGFTKEKGANVQDIRKALEKRKKTLYEEE